MGVSKRKLVDNNPVDDLDNNINHSPTCCFPEGRNQCQDQRKSSRLLFPRNLLKKRNISKMFFSSKEFFETFKSHFSGEYAFPNGFAAEAIQSLCNISIFVFSTV